MWLLFCKSINIFSLCFDVIAKHCKRLIEKDFHNQQHNKWGYQGNFKSLYFFLQKEFTHTKSSKSIQANKKRQHLYADKKHPGGIKSLACFLCFLCASLVWRFVLFVLFILMKNIQEDNCLLCVLCFLCFLCFLCENI